ncbi:40S ribosomal protein S27-2 [Tripterygium wilfordii]|uniref:40S ribosomal protein S27 n=1 Tax=Tripterygium wilfordii TaxID=458696 RepID=A0A7J7D4G8_TRIWF|nr:40S ribosomal protein S27-2 [Tripterygium wilfordii]
MICWSSWCPSVQELTVSVQWLRHYCSIVLKSWPWTRPAIKSIRRTSPNMVLQNDIDLLNPPAELEKKKHKLKRLVQSPNSFFMDVKCQGCFNITTVFSHSQTVVVCGNCQTVLCQPTGGRARLTEGCSFRRKGD